MKVKTSVIVSMLLCFSIITTASANDISQIGFKKKTHKMSDKVVKGACDSSLRSLTKTLENLQKRKDAGKVSSAGFKTYLGNADRYLKAIKSKCPDLDISKEEKQLSDYRAEYESTGGADATRQASIRKGYYDKSIDKLVVETHPAYNNYYRAKVDFLTKAFEYYRHKKPTQSFKILKEAKNAFNVIASDNIDLDLSLVSSEIQRLEGLLNAESGSEISTTLNKEGAKDYFMKVYQNWNSVYTKHTYPPKVLEPTHDPLADMKKVAERFKGFTKQGFFDKVEQAKKEGSYPRVQLYAETVIKGLNDYPRYVKEVLSGAYRSHLDAMNAFGIKGDPQEELKRFEAIKLLCNLVLQFSPNDPTANQWLKEVKSQTNKINGSISYASAIHQKHLGKMLFSKKQVTIGNENEADFTTDFKSGDYIFATVYLPSVLRKLTDSYAANEVRYNINGGILVEPSESAVWVTTPMQEKNVLQFAIVPDAAWKQKYSSNYIKNKLRTHEHIANGLIEAGPYSGIDIDVIIMFRGTGSKIKGSFTIDQSGGVDKLKSIVIGEENARLAGAKLPKAGMSDSNLQNEALSIMRRKSEGSGKTYKKAIITSVNWDYDKTYAGVTVSRSVVIAMVSKEHDGKCMYQYINFKQQAKGNGTFNNNLEFAGAGQNVYISCDNVK